ncbi:hypothetical protein BUALT_Bualt10G0103200 [Buddleja alternifolia]|uniref:Cytochrome P450 n=1 Tax=Buddleja alternifolia TaxID=168488 RepID=A0AAV6X279_9LAMI|nr:hypothetical protein BUALT_Bualt10G0103200 [Buddleja alternifolia]
MEIPLPFNFTTLMLFSSFTFLLITKALKKSKSEKNYAKLLASLPKLPVIGHLHHLVDALPHRAVNRLNKFFSGFDFFHATVYSQKLRKKMSSGIGQPESEACIGNKVLKEIIFGPRVLDRRSTDCARCICTLEAANPLLEELDARELKDEAPWKKSKSHKNYVKLPPSPPKLPVIGHLHHLVDALPHRAVTRLNQKYGPILHLKLGEVSAVVISTREAAKEVLKDQDPACADKPESICSKIMWYDYKDIIFSPYNQYWRQMRKICILELLSPKNVRSFGFIRQDEASRLVESLKSSSGETINLTQKVFAFTSSITCRAAFGEVLSDRDTLIALFRKAIPMGGGFELADLFPSKKLLHLLSWNKYKLLQLRSELDIILDRIIEEHKLKQNGEFGGEDIVDVLLRMMNNGELEFPIGNDNIKAIVFVSDFRFLKLISQSYTFRF